MDEVVEQLESAAISERTEREESNFESYYKNRGRTGSQDERRKSLLETQKQGRKHGLDKSRGILELVQAAEEDIFRTPRTYWRPSVYVHGYQQVANYCNVLTGSEWLLEKPHDFAENWLMVACPKGVRMLVIAYKGTTKFFNKYGNFRFECRTALPGGNPCEIKSKQNTCVLDCFYSKETMTMFVLDILAWNNCVMTEGEAAFRQYWMLNHLEAIPELKMCTKKNKMIFKVLPKIPCTTESLKEFVSVFPYFDQNQPPVDGLLFYHSKAQYFSGETPLVGWLYPYMLSELLEEDLNINRAYLLEKPENYVNYLDFIEKFEARTARKKQRRMCGRRDEEAEADNDGAEPMSTNNNAESAEPENNAVKPLPVVTNNIDIAKAKGDNQITETGNMETDDNVQDQAQGAKKQLQKIRTKLEGGLSFDQGDNASSAPQKQGTKGSKKSATMNSETRSQPAAAQSDEMESMVADIVTEKK